VAGAETTHLDPFRALLFAVLCVGWHWREIAFAIALYGAAAG
jgi:hypothetical protein